MTNLLIPTDFTPASVKLAEQTIKTLGRKVNIVFFHAFELPFFYNDIVRNDAPYVSLITDTYRQACKQLKEKYPSAIGCISFGFMQGNTNALFRNFIEANKIDMIVCPQHYVYTKVHKNSINPFPFFKRVRVPLLQNLDLNQKNLIRNRETLYADIATAS